LADLRSVAEAQKQILNRFSAVEVEQVDISGLYGRILAKDIHAPGDMPAFTSSSMDGFAVTAADIAAASQTEPVSLPVVGEIPAGMPLPYALKAGQAARIMTGAVLPEGANAVVPVELTDMAGQNAQVGTVRIFSPVKAGDFIRPRGKDIQSGQVVLSKFHRLRPQDIGLIASLGLSRVAVYRRPRVALLSSGDELVEPGKPLAPGQIYDSNSFILSGLLRQVGCDMIALGVAHDDPEQITAKLEQAVDKKADLIITSAGVSVGAYDYVRAILEQHGTLDLWRVDVRPGKPLAFGSYEGIPVMGLPGNPVSAFVGFLIFVTPVLRRLAGRADAVQKRIQAVVSEKVESDGRESYLRAYAWQEGGTWKCRLTGNQSSGNLYTLSQANALLIVPSGVKSLPIDAGAELIFLDSEIE
jgi:molybdopterin molybdotransferase